MHPSVEMMGAVELDARMHDVWRENVSGQEKRLTNETNAFQTPGRQNLAEGCVRSQSPRNRIR